MIDYSKTISRERLQLIYDSTLRQFRSGRSYEKVLVNLYSKGLEENEADNLAVKAYRQYQEEEQRRQLEESYNEPLLAVPQSLKTFGIKMISFVLSMLLGHFINLERWTKRNEKRVQ